MNQGWGASSWLCWHTGLWWLKKGGGEEMAGLGETEFLLETMKWSATVVTGAGLFPGAEVREVADFLLGAFYRFAEQTGGNLCFEKGQFGEVALYF